MGEYTPHPGNALRTELTEFAHRRSNEGPYADNLDVDVLIVGAGFGGTYLLYELRKAGYRTTVYDAGTSFGGTWRWNVYPGARVDSEVPIYELAIPEVYETWHWTTNYPDWKELQAYFAHVDKVLNLSKDVAFQTVVTSAEFDVDSGKWTVRTSDGRNCKARFFIAASGMAAKRYIPQFKGLEKYKGVINHTSFWPNEDVDVQNKNVAVIGTGASGVQVAQEWGPTVKSMHVFQRTPNLTIPMRRRDLTKEGQDQLKSIYSMVHEFRDRCFAGFHYDFCERNTFDDTPEEREAFFENLWKIGGFRLWLANYKDFLFDDKANRETYNFWLKKQRARLTDPVKQDLLCPLEPPHPWGVKRPCLEQNYYEVMDQKNVTIVDISDESGNNIAEFTEKGIKMTNGDEYEFEVVALATGFDVATGGLTQMGLKSIRDTTLDDEWKTGINSFLGVTIEGYPNFFYLYAAHGPTLLSNGPSCVEVQGRWIRDAINMITRQDIKYINPTDEATKQWRERIDSLASATLFPKAKRSTYMGGSIPGKKREFVSYAGGLGNYSAEIRACLTGFKGFEVVKA
ncbi:uncharacterized protein A1O5_09178 [Cladophialophora psammophila CBS 110553]|uniref:FAD/NAD(P)-binding domain-containing protein n=1 Tax=Cladophialophora psammophila CBS 110553 TaxID=1182543 RepID=W9WIA6_9EURO|nr:uncharacterized protein A1O5_09178 [Cladophialophora psammophila CBS 110553]EXJ67832.1 hypothetical protein A1O5_09178 [Cladophialophora psammophila CBS 110553]